MLVSHQFKFIFIKTIKTAGTSTESYFERFCMPAGEWQFAHSRPEYVSECGIIGFRGAEKPAGTRYWNHMTAGQIRSKLDKYAWENYYKFTVVRNPYDRMVSAYYYFAKNYSVPFHHRLLWHYENSLKDKFSSFLRTPAILFRRRFSEKRRLTIRNELAVDDWISFETIDADIERVCRKIGVPWQPELLPRLKSRHRNRDAQLSDLYDQENRDLVFRKLRWDFETFGYGRNLPAPH